MESSIKERDFESTYDDSFVLRTKGMKSDIEESGFQSANTFSFGETETDGARGDSGMTRLMKMSKEKKDRRFKFHILGQKVNKNNLINENIQVKANENFYLFRDPISLDQDWTHSCRAEPCDSALKG